MVTEWTKKATSPGALEIWGELPSASGEADDVGIMSHKGEINCFEVCKNGSEGREADGGEVKSRGYRCL